MSAGDGLRAWGRRPIDHHWVLVDAIAAALLTVGALASLAGMASDRTVALSIACAVGCTTAVGWRRAAPSLAALVALTSVAGYQISSHDSQGGFVSIAIVLTSYAVGRFDAARRWRVAAVAGYALGVCTVIELDSRFSVGGDLLTWIPLVVLPIAAGLLVDRRERMADRLRELRSRLLNEQEVELDRAVAEERVRVARELHDVVAHCVTVMVIQSGVARVQLASDKSGAREALRVVARAGREALADLRRVVGPRRRGNDPFAGPRVGLAQLDRLIRHTRAGGVEVDSQVGGEPVVLSPDLDLTVFRIIQEALTNVGKHAPSAQVDVIVTHRRHAVDVRIEDSGPSAVRRPGHEAGHGLTGMHERVSVHGGDLDVGPTAGGGFVVHARLPITSAVPRRSPAAPTALPPIAPRGLRVRFLTTRHIDIMFSAAWLAALEADALLNSRRSGPVVLNVVAVAVMAAAGVIRRRAPFAFLAVVGGLSIALSGGLASPDRVGVVGIYTLFVCSYTVAAYLPRGRAIFALLVILLGVVASTVLDQAPPGTAFGAGLMVCAVWFVGAVARNQRALATDLETATAKVAANRDARALIARYDERARIARDLHAVLARLVTTMVIEAEAAADLAGVDGAAASDAIASIERAGRDALGQMRQMLGVLRNGAGPVRRPRRVVAPGDTTSSELLAAPS
jgi:signal transduction histidine kinase